MERLIRHINTLLAKQDFVVIKGVGGFVAHCKPTGLTTSGKEHTFAQPQREISFNPLIKHDDGLLLESYIKRELLSAQKAENTIAKDVNRLKATLQQEKEVSLGKIGKLTLTEGDQIEFIPSATSSVSYAYFGLAPVTISVLQSRPVEHSLANQLPKKDDYIHIAIHRKKLYRAVSGAAAILIAGLLCIPVSLNQGSTFSAGIVPLPLEELILSPSSLETKEADNLPLPQADRQTPPSPSAEKAGTQKNYYIIVSSCANVQEAGFVVNKLHDEGKTTAGIVEKGERVRVYMDRFDNRETAESALNSVRKEKKEFENAWLFITR